MKQQPSYKIEQYMSLDFDVLHRAIQRVSADYDDRTRIPEFLYRWILFWFRERVRRHTVLAKLLKQLNWSVVLRRSPCKDCNGTGLSNKLCYSCGGSGQWQQLTCTTCKGDRNYRVACNSCNSRHQTECWDFDDTVRPEPTEGW